MMTRMISAVLSITLVTASAAASPLGLGRPAAYGGAPMPGEPGAYVGCWQTRAEIYGGFHVAFCAEPTGTGVYHVKGEGYDCQGNSMWRTDGRQLEYRMGFGACRPKAGWTADRIVCEHAVTFGAAGRGLDCIYLPAKSGERSRRFSAFRQ